MLQGTQMREKEEGGRVISRHSYCNSDGRKEDMQLSCIPPSPQAGEIFQLSQGIVFFIQPSCDIKSDGFDWYSEICHPREVTEFQPVSQMASMVRPVPTPMTAHHWGQSGSPIRERKS